MRGTLILAMFTASLANAGWGDFEEKRTLRLDADNAHLIGVESRSGSLEVTGVANSDEILVAAVIQVPGKSSEKAEKVIEDRLVLTLEKHGDNVVLRGYFDNEGDLVIVESGSGSVNFSNIQGSVQNDS